MSLPTAPKDISSHPLPGSVTDPVNKTEKDRDVDRKLRFYGVMEAFRKGRLPSNVQVDKALKYVLDHSPVHTERLSPEGQKLVHDVQDIIETARRIVLDKNADELFQNFVWHTQEVDRESLTRRDIGETVPVSTDKAKEDSQEAVRHLRTLLHLILTNSEVRKLLSDFSTIGRDLLAKGAHKAAEQIAPPEEKLRGVDQAGPEDHFVSEGGRPVGTEETPTLDVRVPGTDARIKDQPRAQGAPVIQGSSGTEYQPQEAIAEGQGHQRVGGMKSEARRHGEEIQEQMRDDDLQPKESDSPEEAERKKRSIMGKMRDVRDNLMDRIPGEQKDKAKEHYDRGKHFLADEYFPEERRDQFIFRGKKVILECQKHDDYQESMSWLIEFIKEYANHGLTTASGGKDQGKDTFEADPKLKLATSELRTLLERFADGMSLAIIIESVNVLVDDARRDKGLRDWFHDVHAYIRKVLLEPGFILDDESNRQANQLRDSGRKYYDGTYKDHMDNLFDSIGTWFKAMGQDPLNKRFGEDWARLTKDLLFDSEGSLAFKSEVWNDVRKIILPELVDKVGYIPIPRIEYTDESLDLVVENLTLSGRNLFPNIISLEAHNFFKFSPYSAIQDESNHTFTLTFGQMQADMRDVAFYYRKKTGIPKMRDSGIADVIIGGGGLYVTVVLVGANKDKTSVFKVRSVNVKVDSLKFSIRDSKHDFLYKTLKPLATGLVKRQIQKAIADSIRTGFEYIDGQLVAVRDRMQSAKATEGESRTQVLKDLFARKKDESSIKSTESRSFKVVANKRNSILSKEGNPAGWVHRLSEKEALANHGSEWRSDAFTIVP
ncbi:hypothetical protein AMATHDRAFT_70122 [Amanita thiersii Skay4041]|uniref:Uncharacterized protein n=1 Tax=Amanita thiersii Skay4041 TaxID=703135 RepID=A0A2A9NDK2_9AGAR|nr:hypothetical protein AMATHDRAFT_70122 [Amanita thiersii Skay4041]